MNEIISQNEHEQYKLDTQLYCLLPFTNIFNGNITAITGSDGKQVVYIGTDQATILRLTLFIETYIKYIKYMYIFLFNFSIFFLCFFVCIRYDVHTLSNQKDNEMNYKNTTFIDVIYELEEPIQNEIQIHHGNKITNIQQIEICERLKHLLVLAGK
jgi:hypothetical protein